MSITSSALSLIDEIRQAWNWVGLDPIEVIGENDFGDLIIKDAKGKYWRLCPEECYCREIASNRQELDLISTDQEFLRDWYMSALTDLAYEKCRVLSEGEKYCLKIPAFLGGGYGDENLGRISLVELIRFSGEIAKQTNDLPDGAKIRLKVID